MAKDLEPLRPDLSSLRGWDTLTKYERGVLERETVDMLGTIYAIGNGRLRLGEHLSRIRDVLEPRKMFERFLQVEGLRTLKLSRATAYRHITNYERARTILPAPVVKMALMRNMETIDAELVEAFPPPRSADPEIIGPYLDRIAAPPRVELTVNQQAEIGMRECFNLIRTRFERLPPDNAGRKAWMQELIGMQLTLLGVGGQQQLGPVAVPESFRAQPIGRPRKRA